MEQGEPGHKPFRIPAPEDFPVASAPKSDRKALKEQRELFDGKKASVLHGVYIWSIRVASICIGVVFVIRIAHLVMPPCWEWLSPDRIRDIDRFLFSGSIGAIVGRSLKEAFTDPISGKKED